jgi:hypothetical protein
MFSGLRIVFGADLESTPMVLAVVELDHSRAVSYAGQIAAYGLAGSSGVSDDCDFWPFCGVWIETATPVRLPRHSVWMPDTRDLDVARRVVVVSVESVVPRTHGLPGEVERIGPERIQQFSVASRIILDLEDVLGCSHWRKGHREIGTPDPPARGIHASAFLRDGVRGIVELGVDIVVVERFRAEAEVPEFGASLFLARKGPGTSENRGDAKSREERAR